MSAAQKPGAKPLTDETIAASRSAFHSLTSLTSEGRKIEITIRHVGERAALEDFVLPGPVVEILITTLRHLSEGEDVAVLPTRREVSTQEAADLLNVSRPYLVQLLEDGKIPHRKVGTHRRIALQDLLAYKARDDAERAKIADELSRESERLGLP